MKQKKTLAIVLRRTDFGEADRIVNLLTPEGKVSAIARGARRQKSKLAGGIEIFALNEVVIAEGKGDIRTIISARMREFYNEILKDFDRADFAYESIRLIARYSENVENEEFFNILKTTLESLNDFSISLDIVKAWFYIHTYLALGNQIDLATDSNGNKLKKDGTYSFDRYDKTFVPSSGPYNADHIKALRFISVSDPKNTSRINGISKIMRGITNIVIAISDF